MSDTVLLDVEGSPPMTEVYIWIGHYEDGTEGMLSADLPMPNGLGMRHMPLMHTRREVAESLGLLAQQIKSASQGQNRVVRIELRTFRAVADA